MLIDKQFNTITDKLQQLLKQYGRLKKENEQLKTELQQQRTVKTELQSGVTELNQQLAILKLAGGDMNIKDKKEFERKINQYIKEIDKCIAHLGR